MTDDCASGSEKPRQIDVNGDFFRTEIDPVYQVQWLLTRALHTLEQVGNSRLLDLGLAGRASEERHGRLFNEALDLVRRQSPTRGSTLPSVRADPRGRVTRD